MKLTTKQVLEAIQEYQQQSSDGLDAEFPYLTLAKKYNIPEKVAYYACVKAEKKGYTECGVSLRTAWLTEKGKRFLMDNSVA